jgi:ubiquinone/menaquinone biosynthesis C-methylase UbiE
MILDRSQLRKYVQGKVSGYYEQITRHRKSRFLESFDPEPNKKLLALGVGDGALTLSVAEQIRTDDITGIDLDLSSLLEHPSRKERIYMVTSNLNQPFPLPSNTFDVVSSDQTIEHLQDVDNFAEQIYRVLKPGGYAVIFTENLSAWHNLTAMTLGWQAFSQTISQKHVVGKPLSANHFEKKERSAYWNHVHIFTLQGLMNLFEKNGFVVEEKYGAGYFPLPEAIGGWMEKWDPRHAYFIGVKVRKPASSS